MDIEQLSRIDLILDKTLVELGQREIEALWITVRVVDRAMGPADVKRDRDGNLGIQPQRPRRPEGR